MRKADDLAYVDALGRQLRVGNWSELSVGTYKRILEHIDSDDWTEAARLAGYFEDEASVIYVLYTKIPDDLKTFLIRKGTDPPEVDEIDSHILNLLKRPDGTTFDRSRMWHEVRRERENLQAQLHVANAEAARLAMERLREVWRQLHDRDADRCYGLIDAIISRHGDGVTGEMWDLVIKPLFDWRYGKFDVDERPWADSLELLMLVACEAMRGHLAGVDRSGDFELIELDDRFVLRFDPCGSGQRVIRGDPIEGTPARMEPPYGWSVQQEPHSWNHYTPGVCHYCTHCIRLMEEMPIDRFGYPLRIVDPPVYPDNDPDRRQQCQWQMFKDVRAVPDHYYERVGRTRPVKLGRRARAVDAGAEPAGTAGLPGAG